MAISKERCDILPIDTTVECIAGYLAEQVKVQHPDNDVKVTAYEGVAKGSICYA